MTTAVTVRDERPEDADAVRDVVAAAFVGRPYSRQREHHLVDALRADGALALSLVAEGDDGVVVGHVAFSPVRIAGAGAAGWYGLGPLAVRPDRQRRGVGRALVDEGLRRLRTASGAGGGCVLVGDPAYYGRFGFAPDARLRFAGVPRGYFLALPFGPDVPSGDVSFHPAFDA